ncbi:MAG: DUF4317 domain-containing protein [Oscillospiraceae bacterium]|nr:DUF4317 domain-containing protein [Oscillospiraceae bacterium]
MNAREIGEIRRRARRDRSNMTAIYGCYVNAQKEIISSFRQSVAMMPENEAEKYFGVLKRALSGTIGKNLIDVTFRTAQVADSPEHKLLMELRSCSLQNDDLRMEFYKKIIEAVSFEDNYLILIGCDSYDVPFKSSDDEMQADASTQVYTYLLCAICPVKLKKPSLRYMVEEKEFHDGGAVQEVCAPEAGFLFPAFDDRATNIYNALLYSHNTKVSQQGLASALFNVNIPKPAAEQKKSFEALLTNSLEDACSLEVVQTVHEQICQCIEMHKESKVPDPLLISKEQVKSALMSCGVPDKNVSKFSVEFDETFGNEAELHPKNIIDNKKFEIHTPDVSIKVNPERLDLIETRIIGGVKYIMICADEDVEVNGVSIHIEDNQKVEV